MSLLGTTLDHLIPRAYLPADSQEWGQFTSCLVSVWFCSAGLAIFKSQSGPQNSLRARRGAAHVRVCVCVCVCVFTGGGESTRCPFLI